MSNACRILVGIPYHMPTWKTRKKFENIIKINVKEIAGGKRTVKETVEQA
jgi:hypothetical protein